MKKVYLAGPITGSNYDSVTNWREKTILVFKENNIEGLSPMRGKEFLSNEKSIADNYSNHYLSTIAGINIRDYNDTIKSDAVLVNFLGATKVSIGTVMEIAWARAHNVPVVIVIEPENIHQHGMLLYHTIVVTNIEAGINAVRTILNS